MCRDSILQVPYIGLPLLRTDPRTAPLPMSATTIDDVIQDLTDIIDTAKNATSRLGYFPALYRKVTRAVKQGIEDGIFEDGERMERLDVIFANRYLDAFQLYTNGGTPTQAWQVAFDATQTWQPIVLQHLLLGINAHINLDLGIAAAQTMEGRNLEDLKHDFQKINEILSSMIDEVTQELAQIWPLMRVFNLIAGKVDDYLARFGILIAREYAWNVAVRFFQTPLSQQELFIQKQDDEVAGFGRTLARPGRRLRFVLYLVRLGERKSIRRIIEILE